MIGILITGALLIFKVRGALLIGIVLTTLVGIPFGVTHYAGGSYLPTSPYFCNFAFGEIFSSGGRYSTSAWWCSPSCSWTCSTPWAR